MNIKEASRCTGLPAKTIRYYEDIGLVKPDRDDNGYRSFSDPVLHKLAFVGRGRALGFSINECRSLLELYEDQSRASAEVKTIAAAHLAEVDKRIAEMTEMRDTLAELVDCCKGDERPDCPILYSLAGQD
ncbi:Cu(I)-responsive transcriptional regulator [Marivivens aquimaris]|uniref:Cu(I)-responsive transcriptional regulator n=1 Tax=Marivivens aquimaris TaxID=2774876 RepID=UPI0018827A04|nr:Cu(I)-responsive transcriptional regulator [Marivivens aquimaris]